MPHPALLFLKPVKDFLASIPWPVWAALAVVAGVLYYGSIRYDAGEEAGRAEVQAEFDKFKADLEEARRLAEIDARAKEREIQNSHEQALSKLRQEKENAIQERETIIADLRSGVIRLRQRFKCPTSTGVPDDTGSTGGDNGAGESGLLAADAEFLIREAERADRIVAKLSACQAAHQGIKDSQNGRE